MNAVKPILFKKIIAPGTSEILSERIKFDGTVEGVRIKFYSGQERDLKVRPYVEHVGARTEELITYPKGCENYLSGEDSYLNFSVTLPVEQDDQILVEVINEDLENPYTLDVTIIVDYYNGINHNIGGVANG